MKNEHAAALGRLNRGRKKNLSPEERARRRANLNTVARPKRWLPGRGVLTRIRLAEDAVQKIELTRGEAADKIKFSLVG